jgi:Uma2 family endonuclease
VASILHEIVVAWFVAVLRLWARRRGGFALGSEAKIAVGPRRGRKPDVSVFVGARPALGATLVRVAPHLVVEVVSERPRDARRDRVEKIHDYAAAGVKYYWIVDPQLRTLEILERGARGRFAHVLDVSAGRVDRVPGCEGLALDLDDLWREVDEAASRPRGRARRRR